MKKYYESPEAEIEMFTIMDAITTSVGGGLEEGGDIVDLDDSIEVPF